MGQLAIPEVLSLPFQVTVQRRRKYKIETMRETLPLKLLAFDLLYFDGEDLSTLPYEERRRRLVDLLGPAIDYDAPNAAAAGPTIQRGSGLPLIGFPSSTFSTKMSDKAPAECAFIRL